MNQSWKEGHTNAKLDKKNRWLRLETAVDGPGDIGSEVKVNEWKGYVMTFLVLYLQGIQSPT